MTTDKRVLVGRIVGVHGVRGWVRVQSYTEPRTRIFAYQPWQVSGADGEHEIVGVQGRVQGRGLIGKLPGYEDRDAAAALVGATIRVTRKTLPPLSPGEYYWTDLEGLAVVTTQGVALGRVSHLVATGANDVLVVRDGARERWIPFVLSQFVREVDLHGGRLVVDWDPEF